MYDLFDLGVMCMQMYIHSIHITIHASTHDSSHGYSFFVYVSYSGFKRYRR